MLSMNHQVVSSPKSDTNWAMESRQRLCNSLNEFSSMASASLETAELPPSFSLLVLPKKGDSKHPGLPPHDAMSGAPITSSSIPLRSAEH